MADKKIAKPPAPNWLDRWVSDIKDAFGLTEIPPEVRRGRAQTQLLQNGITDEQAVGGVPILSELLYRGIRAYGNYHTANETMHEINRIPRNLLKPEERFGNETFYRGISEAEDAYRTYLGLPQNDNTFSISKYRPSVAPNNDTPYYYKLNNFLDRYYWAVQDGYQELLPKQYDPDYSDDPHDQIESQAELIAALYDSIEKNGGKYQAEVPAKFAMGKFRWGKGEDENGPYLSYYDKWDLEPKVIGDKTVNVGAIVGTPFEIYDRIYYDPQTFEPRIDKPPVKRPPTKYPFKPTEPEPDE